MRTSRVPDRHSRWPVLGDASAMAALHAACFAKSWDAAEIGQFLGVPGCLALLASASRAQAPQGFPHREERRRRGRAADARGRSGLPPAWGSPGRCLPPPRQPCATPDRSGYFSRLTRAIRPRAAFTNLSELSSSGRRPRYYEHGADADIFSLAL